MTPEHDPAYFLYHSIGLYPGKAEEMAAAFADFSATWGAMDGAQWGKVLGQRQAFIDLWGALIEAPEGTLTTSENVTAALYSVLGGLPEGHLRGKRVLIAADCFPSLHFLLAGLAERMGFTLDTVPMRQGAAWVEDEDMVAAWGPDVGLGLLTFVTSTSSHRTDVDVLLAHGRAMGSLVGLDVTQAIGLLPFSVRDTPVDFVVSTSLKWLCGTPGAGILQMRPELLARAEPELRGWFSQPDPFSWALESFEYAPDARRFDNGTPSALACLGSVPALRWHAQQSGLLAQNRMLTAMIFDEARRAGLQPSTPEPEHKRGGSVMFQLPAEADPAAVVAALAQDDIHVDNRSHILRVSPGAMTAERHVERLFARLHALL